MHFLMPAIFSSHSDFKEWFSNPLSGMIEGSQEYNDSIVKRLHQVCYWVFLLELYGTFGKISVSASCNIYTVNAGGRWSNLN